MVRSTDFELTEYCYYEQCTRLVLKEAGLPHLTWHHLRHNAGSYLLSENVPITAVSKILGHANPAVTMSIYAHELKEDFEQVRVAMAKFA
jgi:integrase